MKSLRTLITICLLLTAATLFAQTENRLLAKSNIPFAFNVENQFLPAGQYLIYTVTPERSMRIVSADGKHAAVINTLPNRAGTPSEKSSLMFHRYGGEYFLTQVWIANENVVRTPLTSKKEVELARSGSSYERTTILAFAGR
jgi:hypothetical protein